MAKAYRKDGIATSKLLRPIDYTSTAFVEYVIEDDMINQKFSGYMTQLKTIMGEDNFFNGLNSFLASFSWRNATADNFLCCLKAYYNVSFVTFDNWRSQWLDSQLLDIMYISFN